MLVRVGLAVVGLLAAAWVALSLRNDVLLTRGLRSLSPTVQAGARTAAKRSALASGYRDLTDAQLLNPDETPAIFAAAILSRTGQRAEGVRRLERLIRRYPYDKLLLGALLPSLPPTDPLGQTIRARIREFSPSR